MNAPLAAPADPSIEVSFLATLPEQELANAAPDINDLLADLIPSEPRWGGWTLAELETAAAAAEMIEEEPAYVSRYDRVFLQRRAIEKQLANMLPGDTTPEERAKLERKLEALEERLEREQERSKQDTYRRREVIDEWRTTEEGRDLHNTKRRRKRIVPNRPKAATEEERQARLNEQKRASKAKARAGMTDAEKSLEKLKKADSMWTLRQRAAGKSETEIAAGLVKRQEKRGTA